MSSEIQIAEVSDALAPASEPPQTENVPPASTDAPAHSASMPEDTDENSLSASNVPTADIPTVPILASSVTTAAKQYPKMNLRVNEFGIYELDDTSLDSSKKLVSNALLKITSATDDNTEKIVDTNVLSTTVPNVTDAIAASPKPAENSNGTLNSTTLATCNTESTTAVTTTTATTTTTKSSNGDRERWKQRFPSNTKAKSDIICCKQCDGYGMAEDFVDENFCSERCRKIGLPKPHGGKSGGSAGKVASKRKSTSSNPSSHHADSNIVESSIDSCDSMKESESKSRALASTSWSWSKYLERRRAVAAPERLFTDPYPYGKNGFRVGMKLEGIDPDHQSLFCVLTVAEVQGYRLRLHFDGYSDSHDFWVNADSENIFPTGWCEKNGQKLRPPKNWELPSSQASPSPTQNHSSNSSVRTFSWPQYLKFTSSSPAPRHLFAVTRNEYPVPSAFRIKMKLEAVDRRHAAHSLCVATIANVIGNRFLVHFDGWDSIYDYWADPSCPYVHPVGWAQEHNTTLTPPCDFEETGEEFVWDTYLAKTGATAVPPRAFKPRSPVGFKTGMKLECVDPRNPQLIRVASVLTVKGYRLKIHFDGWSSDFDFWTDDDWPDLHPPGWCAKTGHPLQPPLSLSPANGSVTKETGCPTPGCTGIGHVEGARYANHSTVDTCPYSGQNLHRESPAFPDRLAGEEVDSVPATLLPSTSELVSHKEETTRGVKHKAAVKVEQETKESGDASASASPIPPPQKLEPEAKRSKRPPSIDLPIKTEPDVDHAKANQVEQRTESPIAEQNYDSTEAVTPPPKKPRMSFFTGKAAANDSIKRKSTQNEDKQQATDSDQNTSSDRKHSERAKISNESAADTSPSHSARPKRPIELDICLPSHVNSSLTTPLCWSKHSVLLADVVGSNTSVRASHWTCEEVAEFLAKFGINSLLLERFKHEEIDGEALLSLSQSDLTDLLGVKLGPAIKIRNALLLMREKSRMTVKAN